MHASLPALGSEQPPLPNQTFFSWLRTNTTLFASQIAAVFSFVYFIASLTYYWLGAGKETEETGLFDPQTVKLLLDYFHIVIIAVFILVLIRYLDDNSAGSYRVSRVFKRIFNSELDEETEADKTQDPHDKKRALEKAQQERMDLLRKFKQRFLWFWCMMLALYVAFAWDDSYNWIAKKAAHPTFPILFHSANLATSGAALTSKLLLDRCEQTPLAVSANEHVFVNAPAPDVDSAAQVPSSVLLAIASVTTRDAVLAVSEPPSPAVFMAIVNVTTLGPVEVVSKLASAPHKKAPPLPDKPNVKPHKVAFSWLEFAFNNFSLLMIYWCFVSLHITPSETLKSKSRERWHLWGSGLLISVFTVLFLAIIWLRWPLTEGNFKGINAVFDALSGTLNAVVVALLIARLDSKLIGLSSRLISVLYSYAAVQPLFVAFSQGPEKVLEVITALVLVIVLMSKIYFFLIIMYAMQTGRLLNYFACISKLKTQAAADKARVRCDPESVPSGESSNRFMERLDSLLNSVRQIVYRFWKNGPAIMGEWRDRLSLVMRLEDSVEASKLFGVVSIAVFAALLILSTVTYQSNVVSAAEPIKWSSMMVNVAQLEVVAIMIIILFLVRRDNSCHSGSVMNAGNYVFKDELDYTVYKPAVAVEHVQKFKEYFLWFWVVTFLLYVVLLLAGPYGNPGTLPDNLSIGQAARVLAFPFLKFLLGSVNLLFIFWCFVILQSPGFDDASKIRQRLFINYSSFFIGLLIASFILLISFAIGNGSDRHQLVGYATVFNGLTGLLSGVALALLIARLDSKLFQLRPLLVAILFAYAAIQPLVVVFELEAPVFTTIEEGVLLAALGLKVSLFLIVGHTLQSGKMLNYLVCFPFLRDRVDSIFENQFEIRASAVGSQVDKLALTIWKKNALIYTTDRHFPSRKKCDEAVAQLRRDLPNLDPAHQPKPIAGTYWVSIDLSDPDTGENRCVIESTPLRSEKERELLIVASKQNIPHCKYNRA